MAVTDANHKRGPRWRFWRRLLICVLAAAAVLPGLYLATVALTYAAYYMTAKTFDSDNWKADTNIKFRLSMARSLLHDRDLKTMTYEQIIDLLGTPDFAAPGTTHRGWDIEYMLGPEPGFSPNLAVLVIRVKPGQRATAAAILYDILDL